MSKAERLEGKVTIITGAASGMGKASVERFLDEGATVVALDLAQDGLDALGIPEGRGFGRVVDVTDRAAVKAVVDDTIAEYGRLDCYFNNAGIPQWATPVEDVTDDDWDKQIAVNLSAAFYAAQAVVPQMRKQRSGSFIVTASTAGLRPRPNLCGYNAAKFGVVGFTKSLALEVGNDNIRANVICPVATATPMLEQFGYGTFEETAKLLTAGTPLGRVAEPADIAAMAAFLASDDSVFITGTTMTVDGGRTI